MIPFGAISAGQNFAQRGPILDGSLNATVSCTVYPVSLKAKAAKLPSVLRGLSNHAMGGTTASFRCRHAVQRELT